MIERRQAGLGYRIRAGKLTCSDMSYQDCSKLRLCIKKKKSAGFLKNAYSQALSQAGTRAPCRIGLFYVSPPPLTQCFGQRINGKNAANRRSTHLGPNGELAAGLPLETRPLTSPPGPLPHWPTLLILPERQNRLVALRRLPLRTVSKKLRLRQSSMGPGHLNFFKLPQTISM